MIEHEAMMYSILKKYGLYNKREDYIDICYIGYTKATKSFDGDKASFGTYAYKCMEYELLTHLRKEKTNSRKLNNNLLSIEYKYENGSIKDTLISKDDLQKEIADQETLNELYSAIFKLSIREQYIILNSFNLIHSNKNMKEVYKKLGISKAMAYVVRSEALVKLKRLLDKKDV